jgi:dihydropteroate synthase
MTGKTWTLRTRGESISFEGPQVMGIINLTPDSFYDGGFVASENQIQGQIDKMVSQGATFIDVGGESTRPGSDPVSQEEELRRLGPFFSLLSAGSLPTEAIYSIDTTKVDVAQEALDAGCQLVNCVSGRYDQELLDIATDANAAYVCMHAQGSPKIMQDRPHYEDVVDEVERFMNDFVEEASQSSPNLGSIVIDPGFGFGKRLQDNLNLMNALPQFVKHGHPVMVGVSRKSMIGSLLNGQPAEDRLNGSTVLHTVACMAGVHILRVHDVKEAVETVRIVSALHQGGTRES